MGGRRSDALSPEPPRFRQHDSDTRCKPDRATQRDLEPLPSEGIANVPGLLRIIPAAEVRIDATLYPKARRSRQ